MKNRSTEELLAIYSYLVGFDKNGLEKELKKLQASDETKEKIIKAFDEYKKFIKKVKKILES